MGFNLRFITKALALVLILLSGGVQAESIYDLLIAGKECKQELSQLLGCTYRINDDFQLDIIGIGAPDTAIMFTKSDFKGGHGYYAKYGLLHGCVIVQHIPDMAFISPLNGKVYRDVESCKAGY